MKRFFTLPTEILALSSGTTSVTTSIFSGSLKMLVDASKPVFYGLYKLPPAGFEPAAYGLGNTHGNR